MTKTKFEPVLIFTDEERIEQTLKSADSVADQINEKLNAVESFLGEDLTDDDRLDILNKGAGSFMRLLKKQFKFPNATDEFNVTALGKEKDFEPIKHVVSNLFQIFRAYDFELKNGKVQLSQNGLDVINNEYKFYTKNEKQNEAYTLALELCEKINKAYNDNHIDTSNMYQIEKGINLIKLPLYKVGQKSFIPNHRAILSYKPDGSRQAMYS